MSARRITIYGFLNEFKRRHEQMKDRPFCWVLGSGASLQSGIPTGGALVSQWLTELHELEDFDSLSLEQWATAENLGIPGFELAHAATFYPWIYQRRFRDYKEQGYAFLENAMDHAEPSFGYSVLAQIMAITPHKVAVTTNFDNLIADALSIYTRTFPLVCGHESLTGYIRANLRRPLVAKIHRDLLLAPLSNPDEIAKLPGEWATALAKIFDRFTPIVIGYGGNDGSLMGFLKTLAPIEGGIFWCHREGSEIDPKVHEVVEHHSGRLVPIAGFDELMLQLQEKLQLPFLLPGLRSLNDKRVADYQKQFEALTASLRKPAQNPAAEEARKPARKAAEAAVERLTKEKDWWAWQLKADAERDLTKREAIFRAGIEDFPKSADLVGNFAVFMHFNLNRYDDAERLYREVLELAPNHSFTISNLATLMWRVHRNYDEAERLYRRALELNPDSGGIVREIGTFLWRVRTDYDEAERLYHKAIELDSSDAIVVGNLAAFITDVRKDYDSGQLLYRKALELDPSNATNTGNFAELMYEGRKNYDEAERLYRKSLELDPKNAYHTGYFALFTEKVRKDYDEAERLYRKALELDPNEATCVVNFAAFMSDVRKDYDEADRLYRKALELDPTNNLHAEKYEAFRNVDRS